MYGGDDRPLLGRRHSRQQQKSRRCLGEVKVALPRPPPPPLNALRKRKLDRASGRICPAAHLPLSILTQLSLLAWFFFPPPKSVRPLAPLIVRQHRPRGLISSRVLAFYFLTPTHFSCEILLSTTEHLTFHPQPTPPLFARD